MTNKTFVTISIEAMPSGQVFLAQELALLTNSDDWAVSKGLDGITILIGTVAATAIGSISKILIKHLEEKGKILVEVTIEKKKYKFKGMNQEAVISILQSLESNTNES